MGTLKFNSILPFELEDLSFLCDLQPEGWDPLEPVFRFYFLASFCTPLKVLTEGQFAGVGCAIRHRDTAWIGHIIVHPAHQGRGIGTSMTEYLIALLDKEGFSSISLVATPKAVRMYERIGFKRQWVYRFYKGPQHFRPPKKPDFLIPYAHEHLGDILKLDREVSKEDRRSVLGYHLEKCMLFISGNHVYGAYFPTLGEGMVIAANEEAGPELLRQRMLEKSMAVVPVENMLAIDLIESMQMQEYRQGIRMYYGKPVNLNPKMLYNRIGGNMG